MTQETRICPNCKKDFHIEPEDFEFYEKISVPAPKHCPSCRMQHRLAFRNERSLYRRKCSAPGHDESVLSIFPEQSGVKVYCNSFWYSDGWSALDYGRDYDFACPFFEQFRELMLSVPFYARLIHGNSPNSDYGNWVVGSRDIYLSYSMIRSENVLYSSFLDDSRDVISSSYIEKSELLYECFDVASSSNSRFLVRCRNCVNVSFGFDLINCQNCFMCSNLRNKSYCFRNKQHSKEEYEKLLASIDLGSISKENSLIEELNNMIASAIHRHAYMINTVSCSGDQIHNSRNVHNSYIMNNCENVRHTGRGSDLKDGADCFGAAGELIYECMATGFQNVRCKWHILGSTSNNHNITYCILTGGSSDMFGCVGVRSKRFCILNKQYTESEYNELIPKIIEHMTVMPFKAKNGTLYHYGDNFPREFSPFDYRWTVAHEYYPLSDAEIQSQGFNLLDSDRPNYTVTVKSEDLPDSISEVENSITEEVIECADLNEGRFICTRAFKIPLRELEWLKRINAPLPRLCPNCRYARRIRFRNPTQLWHRKCMCNKSNHPHTENSCLNEFETTYSPERSEMIYCAECYNAEVV